MTIVTDDSSFISGDALFRRLKLCRDLPSPPAIAMKIIELSEDISADAGDIAEVLGRDPALVAKVLRIANSALYALRRRVDNLQQAIFIIGINGTITLALSFSLASDLQRRGRGSLDYDLYWRRSLLAGICGRVLAEFLQIPAKEEVMLGALLQDIGMLALDKAIEGFYADLGSAQRDHEAVRCYEIERVGVDHAEVGAWLMQTWNLPRQFGVMVEASHSPLPAGEILDEGIRSLPDLVIVASSIADLWLWPDDQHRYAQVLQAINALGVAEESMSGLLDAIGGHIPEIERAYDWPLGGTVTNHLILDRAKEMILLRNLSTLKNAAELQAKAQALETRAHQLEQENRTDSLTGLYNRLYFDKSVVREFARAKQFGWPLSLVFIDLDHFKLINDNYGHQGGDAILSSIGELLRCHCRDTDLVARYGGEEFVMLMPGSDLAGAKQAADRILSGLRTGSHKISGGHLIAVTASIGIATQGETHNYGSVEALIHAADCGLYAAKLAGRDRVEVDAGN